MSEGIGGIAGEVKRRGPGLYLRGLAMGAADVVPGVSGGTVAFVTGIYDELVGTLAGVNTGLLTHLVRGRLLQVATGINAGFLVPLLAGIGTAGFTLARPVIYLMKVHPHPFWGLLTGLLVASAIAVGRRVDGWGLAAVGALVAGAAAGYGITLAVPLQTGPELYKFALSGAVASIALILPGISGSLLLVLLGKYEQFWTAVHELDLALLAVFAAGFAAGILAFSRILKRLLAGHHTVTMASLVGVMAGSMRKVWPFRVEGVGDRFECSLPTEFSTDVVVSVMLMAGGVVLVLLLDRLHHRGET